MSVFASFVFLLSCDRAKDEFIADCTSGGNTSGSCECYHDYGKGSLEARHMKLFGAMASRRDDLISRAQVDLGMIGTGVAMAKIGWVVANAEKVCANR